MAAYNPNLFLQSNTLSVVDNRYYVYSMKVRYGDDYIKWLFRPDKTVLETRLYGVMNRCPKQIKAIFDFLHLEIKNPLTCSQEDRLALFLKHNFTLDIPDADMLNKTISAEVVL